MTDRWNTYFIYAERAKVKQNIDKQSEKQQQKRSK